MEDLLNDSPFSCSYFPILCFAVLTTQLNCLASLAQWLSVCLRTKWLWV